MTIVAEKNEVVETVIENRGKAFVAFQDKTGDYIGRYTSLSDFAKQFVHLGIQANNLRPVLKGQVRQIKGMLLFYANNETLSEKDGSVTLDGYDAWKVNKKLEKDTFPHDLYFQKGFILGFISKVPMTAILEQLKKQGWKAPK